MAFPQSILGLLVQLEIDGTWTDISGDCRGPGGTGAITGGRGITSSGGSVADRAQYNLVLDNNTGKYSSRNPRSPYFGKIGRNTPIRIAAGAGAPFLAVPTDGTQRASTPDAAILNVTDLDVRADVEFELWGDGTGTVEVAGKYGAGSASWMLVVTANGTPQIWWTADGTTQLSISSTVPISLPPYSRQTIRATLDVNNGASGRTATFYTSSTPGTAGPWTQLGAPVVQAGVTSIFDSTAPMEVGDISAVGFENAPRKIFSVEVRSTIGGTIIANPNFEVQAVFATSFADTAPSARTWTVTAGALHNYHLRFAGVVTTWPPQWDTGGFDVTTPITASGILQRLNQGDQPLQSTLRRRIPSDPNLIAYWPMEETGGNQAFSPVPGVRPMRVLGMGWAGDDTLAGSDALPVVQAPCSISAAVPITSSPTGWRAEFVFHLDTIPASLGTAIHFTSNGTVKDWMFKFGSGSVDITGLDGDGTELIGVTISPILNTDLYGPWVRHQLYLSQSGGTVTWTWAIVVIGVTAEFFSATYSGTTGACTGVNSVFSNQVVGMAIGHIAIFKSPTSSIFDNADIAFAGETSYARAARLSTEQAVDLSIVGDAASTEKMGAQVRDTYLNLLTSAVQADEGLLHEHRETPSLRFRTLDSLYNQPSMLDLPYTPGDDQILVAPLTPVDDDQVTANDVTVNRVGGSSARVLADPGPLDVATVGQYDTSDDLTLYDDTQPEQHASWKVHIGTWDEARFPQVNLQLENDPSLIQAVCRLETGSRIRITGTIPSWLPPEDIDLLVIGYSEVLGQFSWTVQLVCIPYGPYRLGEIEGPDNLIRLDTAGSTLTADVTNTATALTLTTGTGPRWVGSIQYPAEFPYDLMIAGERVTVNSLTGVVGDDFTRTVASGWGTSNTGNAWTASGGAASDFAVTGGLGQMSLTSVATPRWALTTSAYADVNINVFLLSNKLAVGASQYFAIAARAVDTSNTYLARLAANTDQTMTLSLIKIVTGTETTLATIVVPSLTHVANTAYGLRFRVRGTTLQARAWPFAYAEPGLWHVQVTDSTYSAAGKIGIRSTLNTGTTNATVVMGYDGFEQVTPQMAMVTRSVNGIVKAQTAGTDVRLADPTYLGL